MVDPGREWKATITGKSPNLSRGCCNAGDAADERDENENERQNGGGSKGVGRGVGYLNNGNAGTTIQQSVDIAGTEAESYQHGEPESTVAKGSPDHG